ncbi:hypothetical protein BDF22DRAFT_739065 [Syncephalis plumigaleata]|nr:hypothetical protein BDF22DRAFT_739065 [Syncephalis plumigaleata]
MTSLGRSRNTSTSSGQHHDDSGGYEATAQTNRSVRPSSSSSSSSDVVRHDDHEDEQQKECHDSSNDNNADDNGRDNLSSIDRNHYDMYPQLLRKATNQSSSLHPESPANLATGNVQNMHRHHSGIEGDKLSHASNSQHSPHQLSQPRWDLYPLMQRRVENSGTEEQRHTLHEQEHATGTAAPPPND